MIANGLNERGVKDMLSQRFQGVAQSASPHASIYSSVLANSTAAYQRKHKKEMPASTKAVLMQSLDKYTNMLLHKEGKSRDAIMSATSDVSKVDNPITLAYNLMSILIPNFAYTEVIGIQPIPTKESPIFYPRISANEDRNNVTKGTSLLGATNWCESNSFTTNQVKTNIAIATSGGVSTGAFTAPEGNITKGSLSVQLNLGGMTYVLFDDGEGAIIPVDGIVDGGTVNYSTGAVSFTFSAEPPAGSTGIAKYRYEFDSTTKPAQAILEWVTSRVRAEPYRIRTIYQLDDFFQIKQVLNGYDIDSVLSSSVAGYINKEISGNVFDDILLKSDGDYAWDSANPTGVAWALHRLSLMQTFVRAANGIRMNIARSPGNVAVCGNEWMNWIETLGDDLWKPNSYSEEPIGPYVAGTLAGKIKILKNQDYPESKATMVYKRDDVDASFIGGVFIGLYATNPLSMDDLSVIQGMGTQFGWTKTFDNSVVSLTLQ